MILIRVTGGLIVPNIGIKLLCAKDLIGYIYIKWTERTEISTSLIWELKGRYGDASLIFGKSCRKSKNGV